RLAAHLLLSITTPPPPTSTLFPYTTLFRSHPHRHEPAGEAQPPTAAIAPDRVGDGRAPDPLHVDLDLEHVARGERGDEVDVEMQDRKSTRLNSSHVKISYAVFCLKKKKATE